METIRENKMGTMPIGKLMVNMSGPMVISMLVQALYNVVDSMYVSKLGQDALNAVSLAFPMQSLLMAFTVGTGVGMNALISRNLGKKDLDEANRAAGTGVFLYICTGVVFGLIGLFFAGTFYRIQTDNVRILTYGTDYLHVCTGCALAVCAQMCSERLLQSTGKTGLAMIPQVTGAVCNIILDPILIFGYFGFPRLEVLGAAVATVIGQTLASVIGFTLHFKRNREVRFGLKDLRFRGYIAKEIYRIGSASIVTQAINSFTLFGMNKILIGFTEAATAVFGAYYKLQSFIFLPVFGMNSAIVPIISYNYGAHKYGRVRETIKVAILSAVGIMCIGILLLETIPGTLLSIFHPSEEMLSVGRVALRIIATTFPFAGFCIIAGSGCQALGKPVYSLINAVCRQVVILFPAAYLLSLTGRLELVWLAYPIAEVSSVVLSSIFLKRTLRTVLGNGE